MNLVWLASKNLYSECFVFLGCSFLVKREDLVLFISSVLFIWIHLPTNWISTISYLLAGLMYGMAYLRIGTIWASIGLHFGWNYFQAVIFGFPVSKSALDSVFPLKITSDILLNGGEIGTEGSDVGSVARLLIIALIIIISRKFRPFMDSNS